MSNFGKNKEADDMVTNFNSFWEQHKDKIMLGGGILASLILNHKINALDAKTGKSFKLVANAFDKQADYIDDNLDAIYKNFRIIRSDLVNIATHVAFQGKLGVNQIPED